MGHLYKEWDEKVQLDKSKIITLEATDTWTKSGYWICECGAENCEYHRMPCTHDEVSNTKVKQLVKLDGIKADDRIKKIVAEKTFGEIAEACSKYLSNHKDLRAFAEQHGCGNVTVKVTPKYGSFWVLLEIILTIPEVQAELGNILQNIISTVMPGIGQLAVFLGTQPLGLYFAIGLTALAAIACLAYGVPRDNRALILGAAFVTATSGAGLGASLGSAVPVVGTAVGGTVGFAVGMATGAVLGLFATKYGQ